MTQTIPVAIVGAGQAGLSASYYLKQRGIPHVVFEKHRIGHAWRDRRWDSFCLVTPNWQCRLPDYPYSGADPHGFMLKDDIVAYVTAFAASFGPPVLEDTAVTRITQRADGRYLLVTSQGDWLADQVLIATGGYDTPIIPPYAAALDPPITQMVVTDYRNPGDLPDGATLVVGTGQSGVQMMEDLHLAGRRVHLAVGPAPRSPRSYRGKDATTWLYEMGHYAMTIDRHPDPERAVGKTNHYMTGRDGGHEIDLRKFRLDGVQLYGSLAGFDGTKASFLPDLGQNLDDADASYLGIRKSIDDWITAQNIDAPQEPPFEKLWHPDTEITELDMAAAGITSVLWCIGFRPDYSAIAVDVFDARGRPVHQRGVCANGSFYFLGLGWLNTWGSGRFLGVAEDAAHVVAAMADRVALASRKAS